MNINPLSIATAEFERCYVNRVIAHFRGDRGQSALALKISLATLYRKLGSSAASKEGIGPRSVYLLRNKRAGAYKIGCSASPSIREGTLQAQDPGLELVASWPGTMLDEATLHRRFAEKRVRGEWFALTEQDLTAIREYFEQVPY